ncbi:CdaR family transcriptional regulator [Halanaerobacter jeridensis]|uniref:Carbohydrate diacid regulator n=1 Tax=Halanaerobacter jeridensis TaxID=706427 RepID=A0A939BSD8_9FIRM|nr:sugar diacid recognition domain-containing protein [Halanaerobacter jeridensis]MBM7557031.1 carbohydrate diacid regulator [Halanaerobacter jeridensis]
MKITENLASLIVNRTTKLLGKNINIMDENGLIIGSGDKERIDQFHEGAEKVISSGDPLEISHSDAQNLKGVKPGINLPIEFNEQIVGVVGITGAPDKIRDYAELVKITAELMLQQSVLEEEIRLEDRAHDNFIQDLISLDEDDDKEFIKTRAEILGYNMMISRVAVVIGIDNFWEFAYHKLNKKEETVDEGIYIQQLKNQILSEIKDLLYQDQQDMISMAGNNNFLVIKSFHAELKAVDKEEYLFDLAAKIKELLSTKYDLNLTIGIGNYHPGIEGISNSFSEAKQAREIGAKLFGSDDIYHINELEIGKLLEEVSPATKKWFSKITLGTAQNRDDLDETLVETLDIFFANDLNVSQTARKLYIHRNTLLYRLDKVKDKTNLDPRQFSDALRLKLALMIREYNE